MREMTDGAKVFRDRGLRVTPQRRAVWSALSQQHGAHPTAEQIFEQARAALPELSRATVYNALRDFAEVGLVRSIDGPGGTRFDADVEPHQHFRCRRCGLLLDVRAEGVDALVFDVPGAAIDRVQIVAEGLCAGCGAVRRQRLAAA